MSDISSQLQAQIQQAYTDKQNLVIQGNNSKSFLGYDIEGQTLNIQEHCGIIDYQATELTLKARAGTTLLEINELLSKHNQKMGFNPPQFSPQSTLGGTVATKQSGPQAPFNGSVRDAILGIQMLDGQGNILNFGGQVMKNVAGYDISRFMSGSYGTLGVLLNITFRLHPIPAKKITVCLSIEARQALTLTAEWIRKSVPVSAACHIDQQMFIELTGTEQSLQKYLTQDVSPLDEKEAQKFWASVRDQHHDFFLSIEKEQSLWRIIVPANTDPCDLKGDWMLDWAGSQRWFKSTESVEKIRAWANKAGGYATLFRSAVREQSTQIEVFEPLAPALSRLHQRIKSRFDPGLILNKGKMYPKLDLQYSAKTKETLS